jgi:hypothetical protein
MVAPTFLNSLNADVILKYIPDLNIMASENYWAKFSGRTA